MSAMEKVHFNGDGAKWKVEFVKAVREVYDSKLTLEHWIMHCALKAFEGKNSQVQAMIVENLNDDDQETLGRAMLKHRAGRVGYCSNFGLHEPRAPVTDAASPGNKAGAAPGKGGAPERSTKAPTPGSKAAIALAAEKKEKDAQRTAAKRKQAATKQRAEKKAQARAAAPPRWSRRGGRPSPPRAA